jgi:hypothetical protein
MEIRNADAIRALGHLILFGEKHDGSEWDITAGDVLSDGNNEYTIVSVPFTRYETDGDREKNILLLLDDTGFDLAAVAGKTLTLIK